MNKYIGKVCPFCKSEFKEGDNIVLCSTCDMPHHKECWIENQGCTTFGCLGTIRGIDDTVDTVTEKEIVYEETLQQTADTVFCTRCGTPNTSSFSFCSKCGNKLESMSQVQTPPVYPQGNPPYTAPSGYTNQAPVYQQPVYNQPVYNQNPYGNQNNAAYANRYSSIPNYVNYNQGFGIDQDMAGLIGTNISYYLPRFQKMKSRNETVSWNWAAFFFAPYWFMYRKMYGYGIAAFAGCLLPVMMETPALFFAVFAGYIIMGIFANYIYMKELEKKARKAKAWSEPYHSQFIMRNGGGNVLAVVLSMIGYFIANMMLTYYML